MDRHYKIIEAANTLVLGDREFETMTSSLRNLTAAFSARYHSLTESWKQQRLDTGFLVECFAGGIFNDWHGVFQDVRIFFMLLIYFLTMNSSTPPRIMMLSRRQRPRAPT